MIIKLTINGAQVDLYGKEKITASYKVAPLLDISSPTSSKTTEFNLPPTSNNLSIFENCNVLINSSTLPFDLIDARLYVNGVDTQIRYCKLYSYSEDIKCRLYGSETDFFSLIADKYLTDLDLSDLDLTWDIATIAANLQTTENILFPIINYGFVTPSGTGSNIIDGEYCFPSIYMHTLLTRLVEAAGYTLNSSLSDYFDAEILPFSNKKAYYISEQEAEDAAILVKQISQSVTSGSEDKVNFSNIPQPQFGTFDYTNDEYTIPITGYYTFKFKSTLSTASSSTTIKYTLYKDAGGGTLVDEKEFTGVSTATSYEYEFTSLLFDAGDKIYVKIANSGAVTCSVANGEFSLTELKREVYFNGTWDVALNLPKIKQGDIIKEILQRHEAVIYTDSINKVVYIASISTIEDTFPDDWSYKIDLSKEGETIFDYGKYAQLNHCTYQDDETVTKPYGTDYDFAIENKSLDRERDLFKSLFGATESEINFADRYYIPKIAVFETNTPKPRILYAEMRTLNPGEGISFYEAGAPTGTASLDICFPYFFHPGRTYDLTWSKLFTNNLPTFTEIITAPKVVKCSVRLNESDLNQLDFTRPVYIDYYKANFFISEIVKELTDSSPATVELIKL